MSNSKSDCADEGGVDGQMILAIGGASRAMDLSAIPISLEESLFRVHAKSRYAFLIFAGLFLGCFLSTVSVDHWSI